MDAATRSEARTRDSHVLRRTRHGEARCEFPSARARAHGRGRNFAFSKNAVFTREFARAVCPNAISKVVCPASNDDTTRAHQSKGWAAKPRGLPLKSEGQPSHRSLRSDPGRHPRGRRNSIPPRVEVWVGESPLSPSFAPLRRRSLGRDGADPLSRGTCDSTCERHGTTNMGRSGQTVERTLRGAQMLVRAVSTSAPCEGEGRGVRPCNDVDGSLVEHGVVRSATGSSRTCVLADSAESTLVTSVASAPCARWDGDPVVAREMEEMRRRPRGDVVRRRSLEEMRGFELVGTSSRPTPPGRVCTFGCHASIAMGSAPT